MESKFDGAGWRCATYHWAIFDAARHPLLVVLPQEGFDAAMAPKSVFIRAQMAPAQLASNPVRVPWACRATTVDVKTLDQLIVAYFCTANDGNSTF